MITCVVYSINVTDDLLVSYHSYSTSLMRFPNLHNPIADITQYCSPILQNGVINKQTNKQTETTILLEPFIERWFTDLADVDEGNQNSF